MRHILLCFTLLIIIGCRNSPKQKANAPATQKEWKFIMTERKQHFLHLAPCDSINASFHYVNNTGKVQNIDTVKVSCACTNVRYKHAPIKPNEQGDITLTIDLKGDSGYFSKVAGVYFHGQKPVVLKVMGKISK